jgi:hypothetical protein
MGIKSLERIGASCLKRIATRPGSVELAIPTRPEAFGNRQASARKRYDVSRIRYFCTIVVSFFARPGEAFR